MTPTETAWLAGFFDGEGCIRAMSMVRRPGWSPHYMVNFLFTQGDRRVLDHILILIGHGAIRALGSSPKHRRPRPTYQLTVRSHVVILRLIDEILPYCLVKRDQLLLTKKLLEALARGKNGRTPTEAHQRYRAALAEDISLSKRDWHGL